MHWMRTLDEDRGKTVKKLAAFWVLTLALANWCLFSSMLVIVGKEKNLRAN